MGSYADSKYAPQDKCYAIENTTKFYKVDFESLKAMVADAKPETVVGVAHAWEQVHNRMVVDDGGGIRAYFDRAIDEVLQHWEGSAAKAFRERAKKISQNVENGAKYAKLVGDGMSRAHEALSAYKQHLDGMEMPDWGDRAWDWATDHIDRQDKNADVQLAGGKSATQVVKDNEDDLSAQKETQLKAAATMEYLGAAYRTNAAAIGKPASPNVDDPSDIPPPDNSGIPPVHYPLPASITKPKGTPKGSMKPVGQAPGPGFSSDGVKTPGISGGIGNTTPGHGSFSPHVGTGLDSLTPPQGGVGTGGGPGVSTGGMSGGAGPGGGAGAGHGGLPDMPGGMAGGAGGRTGGTTGGAGGRAGGITGGVGSRAGGAAGTGAAGRGTGRAGMPGMGGAGAVGAKGGAKGAGAAGRGAGLARQKGGVVGAGSGGKTTAGSQGGSGLHRSRGGAQPGAGASGSRRPAGMSGAHGAHGAKAKDDKGQNGQRPDYLVEDEETWTTERNVAPKVIE
ncbi:hypothetical protein [Streptomyces sp. NPDC054765]